MPVSFLTDVIYALFYGAELYVFCDMTFAYGGRYNISIEVLYYYV